MAAEDILIKFLVILVILFFLPKVIKRFYKVPYPITEIILGILLGIFFSKYFFIDDTLQILSTIGIITLFVYSGMDVDTKFVLSNKRVFIENLVRHLAVFLAAGIGIKYFMHLSYQISFIVALALTTPSASYILSSLDKQDKNRKWVEGNAISGEILGILLLIIFIDLNKPVMLAITLAAIIALVLILPHILKFLYQHIFSKLIGTEFSFIFVVALLSAYVTNFLGIHFLIGAFIAGVVSRKFLSELNGKTSITKNLAATRIAQGFGFFAAVFVPFYFFTQGLKINLQTFSLQSTLAAAGLCILVSAAVVYSTSFYRILRLKETAWTALKTAYKLISTLVFTFVIADLLLTEFSISQTLFNTLMLYGVFTAVASFLIQIYISRSSRRKKHRT